MRQEEVAAGPVGIVWSTRDKPVAVGPPPGPSLSRRTPSGKGNGSSNISRRPRKGEEDVVRIID